MILGKRKAIFVDIMRISLTLLILIASLNLQAQSHHHLTTDQGLATNVLSTIIRDKNNFMWFASYNGLHKHEGSRIRIFNKTGKDSSSISGLEMHGLFEDRQGCIWIGTTNGLDKIDPVTGYIKHYTLRSPGSTSAFVGYIYSIFQDKYDSIWISTDAALFRMSYQTGAYTIVPQTQNGDGIPLPVTGYKSGIKTSTGLWIYTTSGLNFYDYASRKFFHRYHNPQNKPIFRIGKSPKDIGASTDMVMGKDSNLYFIITHEYLGRYNLKTEKLDSFRFVRPQKAWYCCYSLAADKHNNIWIGTRHGGILVFNNNTGKFTSIQLENNNSHISSNYISSMCEDYLGRMWITTDKGLDIVDLYNEAVQQKYLNTNPLFSNVSFASGLMSFDSNFIYIPFAEGGLTRFNYQTGEINHWPVPDTTVKRISYVYPYQKNLFAAVNRGFAEINLKTSTLELRQSSAHFSRLLKQIPGDVVWVHRNNDQSVFFKKTNGSLYYYNGTDSLEKIASQGFRHLACASRDGKFLYYIDYDLNLAKRDLQSNTTIVYNLHDQLNKLDFFFANPRDLSDDGKGNIWITSQNGLIRYNLNSRQPFTYSTDKGLSHGFTYALCTDSTGHTWVSSLGGIDLYNQSIDRFQNVVKYSSGAYMDAFGSSIVLPDGRIYFHTGNRLIQIKLEIFLKLKPSSYELKLTGVRVNNHPLDWQNSTILSNLSHSRNRVEISFSLLDFDPASSIKYYYYLDGMEDDWIETSRTEILYNSLPPGKYVFRVKAVDPTGRAIGEEIKLPIRIYPPFWKTWWFRVLAGVAIILGISAFYKRRIRRVKEKAELRQQLTELEARALRAQMNPHFIFNSLNAIQELIVTKNVTEAYQYLSRFSKLLRLVLNNSEKNFIPLSAELEMNRLYLELEALRFNQSFQYEISVDDKIEEETTKVPSLIFQPFLENAIWHGLMHKEGPKKLFIDFKEESGKLICTIEDNGVGREKAAALKMARIGGSRFDSKGMTLTRQRLETLNKQLKENMLIDVKDLYDEKGLASGTRITITLPQI